MSTFQQLLDQFDNLLGNLQSCSVVMLWEVLDPRKSAPQHETSWPHCCVRHDLTIQSCPDRWHTQLDVSYLQTSSCMEGFLISDYYNLYPKFVDMILLHIKEMKINYIEDIAEGLESGLATLVGLFSGWNVGKQVVLVARF
ncbi:2-alkenal reductase (NADP(+)-dependent) [Camellia lanceoleosa]|uniref:2-alkenal reductase (NADP(+)-dependent) n=1 Tax=Camellia lanceoleosa TaxID=1840588 RepID=A0ACC0HHD9_9ERIC|nr:2-alkenal reductase (NADP(+)-dependent) [Camellia lanceoleosa]